MCKRIAILLLILVFGTALSSCSPAWMEMYDEYPEAMGKVQIVSDDDEGNYHIEYEGQRYDRDESGMIKHTDYNEIREDDILIGWDTLPIGIWYLDEYYSYTTENPLVIYMPRLHEAWIRSDYEYETDVFVIEGTQNKFVFSDMLTVSSAFSYSYVKHYPAEKEFILYSEQCPRLQIVLRLFCVDDIWYVGGQTSNTLFEIPDEFLDMLEAN